MISRRTFLAAAGAGLTATAPGLSDDRPGNARKKLAVVTTEWRYRSHAWHMAERFLVGYPINGTWHTPGLEVVAA